jgi:hypothetical protein
MRASRQTELQREFPLHVVCSWLGNSPRIAQQSYLLVTEDDFAKGAGVAKVIATTSRATKLLFAHQIKTRCAGILGSHQYAVIDRGKYF